MDPRDRRRRLDRAPVLLQLRERERGEDLRRRLEEEGRSGADAPGVVLGPLGRGLHVDHGRPAARARLLHGRHVALGRDAGEARRGRRHGRGPRAARRRLRRVRRALEGDGEEREFPWEATRSVQAADVVGAWQLKIVTPDGETLQPVLTITEKGKVLGATYDINDKTVDVTELKLKDNQLSFEVDSEYQGSPLHVAYKGKPQGSKLKGSLEYSVDGNSGQLEFTGMLKEKK